MSVDIRRVPWAIQDHGTRWNAEVARLKREKVAGYRVTAWHGEGRSLFYLVEVRNDPDTHEIVRTFHSREAADTAAKERNAFLRMARG